jgi:hypothetical protein
MYIKRSCEGQIFSTNHTALKITTATEIDLTFIKVSHQRNVISLCCSLQNLFMSLDCGYMGFYPKTCAYSTNICNGLWFIYPTNQLKPHELRNKTEKITVEKKKYNITVFSFLKPFANIFRTNFNFKMYKR